MNIKLFKAKLRRWLFRRGRGSRKARECNRCCLTCRKYFECVSTDEWMRLMDKAQNEAQKIALGFLRPAGEAMEGLEE